MRKRTLVFVVMFLLLQLAACGGTRGDGLPLVYSHSMELSYAAGFSVDYYEGGYVLATVDGCGRFLLVPQGEEVPGDMPKDVAVLHRPVSNIYLAASAAMDMFVSIGALDQIRFSSLKQEAWHIREAKEAMAQGEILYAGKYAAPDYERILAEGCGLAIENTMVSHTPQVKEQLEGFGIPVLVDYSSYEKEPLGRMEWVRLYGVLTGEEEAAEAAFAAEQAAFEAVGEAAGREKGTQKGSTVAFFYITKDGAANVRRPSDYLPKMIEYAGGVYCFQDLEEGEKGASSVALQMEEFYAAAKEADYLVYNSAVDGELTSVEDLLGKSPLLRNCKAVREGNVFCTTKDLYQSSMALGTIAHDFHEMLTGREENLTYLYRLQKAGE